MDNYNMYVWASSRPFDVMSSKLNTKYDTSIVNGNKVFTYNSEYVRYCKSATINGVTKALLFTFEKNDMERAEKFYNQAIKEIKTDKNIFEIFKNSLIDTPPTALGIKEII